MQGQETEYIWSHANTLNDWLIKNQNARQYKHAFVLLGVIFTLAVTYRLRKVHNPNPEQILQIAVLLLICGIAFFGSVWLDIAYRLWAFRKYGVQYKLNHTGISINWGSKKWEYWSTTSLPWKSLVSYFVEPLDNTKNSYRIRLVLLKGRACCLYVDNEQLPSVLQLLACYNLHEKVGNE